MNISTETFSNPRELAGDALNGTSRLDPIANSGDPAALTLEQTQVKADLANGAESWKEDTALDPFYDIPLQLTVELGRTRMEIRSLLQLSKGSVVELNTATGRPLDLLVNGSVVARGDVVMVGEKLGIRLTEVLKPSDRLRKSHRP